MMPPVGSWCVPGSCTGRGSVRRTPSSCCPRLRGAGARLLFRCSHRLLRVGASTSPWVLRSHALSKLPRRLCGLSIPIPTLSSVRFACLSTICLFRFLLNKMGISLCLFVRIFCIHLLFTSFVFLRCLQQILAGCSVCVINKTAVKILTVQPNCQP